MGAPHHSISVPSKRCLCLRPGTSKMVFLPSCKNTFPYSLWWSCWKIWSPWPLWIINTIHILSILLWLLHVTLVKSWKNRWNHHEITRNSPFFGLAVGQCAIVLAASKDVVPDPVDAIVAGGRLLGFFTKRGRLMGISWGYHKISSGYVKIAIEAMVHL